MWYFADFNILIRKIILNKFQFQPQSVLNLFLCFLGDFSLSVLIKFVIIKKKKVYTKHITKHARIYGRDRRAPAPFWKILQKIHKKKTEMNVKMPFSGPLFPELGSLPSLSKYFWIRPCKSPLHGTQRSCMLNVKVNQYLVLNFLAILGNFLKSALKPPYYHFREPEFKACVWSAYMSQTPLEFAQSGLPPRL